MNVVNESVALFFPPQTQDCEVTFDSALKDLATQRIARIAKAVFFTISTIAAIVAITLTESGVVSWPLALPAILTTLAAWLVFYRLNSLDSTYIEKLTDDVRESCAKRELERILLGPGPFTEKEVEGSLKGVNRLLSLEIFNEQAISNILSIHSCAGDKSIGEVAVEQNKPIAIVSNSEWIEQGRFGLPSYELNVGVNWTGLATDPIVVKYQSKVKVEERPDPFLEMDKVDEMDNGEH